MSSGEIDINKLIERDTNSQQNAIHLKGRNQRVDIRIEVSDELQLLEEAVVGEKVIDDRIGEQAAEGNKPGDTKTGEKDVGGDAHLGMNENDERDGVADKADGDDDEREPRHEAAKA